MVEVKKSVSAPQYVPDFMAKALLKVDFAALKQAGVKYIALDADSTLVPYRGIEIDEKTKRYLARQKKHVVDLCIASNRVTSGLDELGLSIGAPVVPTGWLARKPRQRYFKRIITHFGAHPQEIAMIGDKLFADIWGANRAGFVTVWVEHLGADGLHDRALGVRTWERLLIKKHTA